jgi:hypothetical protein
MEEDWSLLYFCILSSMCNKYTHLRVGREGLHSIRWGRRDGTTQETYIQFTAYEE